MVVQTKPGKFLNRITTGRFSVFFTALTLYLSLCLVIRIIFLFLSSNDTDPNPLYMARAFFTGFLFDLLIGLLYLCFYGLYLLLVPSRFIGSLFDKIATYLYFFLFFIIMYFSLLAEIPFWDEFGVRFNFIAVDYLIYTYEVVENINQSYPLPLVIILLAGLVAFTFFLFEKLRVFQRTFSGKISFRKRIFYFIPIGVITILLGILLKNKQAEFSNNLVINELGKNGAFFLFLPSDQTNWIIKPFIRNFPIQKPLHWLDKICYRRIRYIVHLIRPNFYWKLQNFRHARRQSLYAD